MLIYSLCEVNLFYLNLHYIYYNTLDTHPFEPIIMKNNKKKNGFAITEILLSIAVIIIVGVSAYALYSRSRSDSNMNIIEHNVSMLQTALTKFDRNTLVSSRMDIETLGKLGLVPDSINKDSSGEWRDSTGTSYLVLVSGIGYSKFVIRMRDIKGDECASLTTRLSRSFSNVWIVYGGQSLGPMKNTDPDFMKKISLQCGTRFMPFEGIDIYDDL